MNILLIAAIISISRSKELPNEELHLFTETNQAYELMLGERKMVRYLENMGAILNISVFHHNILDNTKNHICSSVHQKVKVIETQDSFMGVIPHNPQVSPLEEERIVSMVHITDGVFIVTNYLRAFQYRFEKIEGKDHYQGQQLNLFDFSYLRPNKTLFQNRLETAYNPITNNMYLVFNDEIIILSDDQNMFKRVPINATSIEGIACSSLYLYVATQKYIMVFKTFDDDLVLKHKLTNFEIHYNNPLLNQLDITDLAVGGREGELLYVLDKNEGVSVLMIGEMGIRSLDLGLIEVRGGFKMDQYQDKILMVLVEGVGSIKHNKAIEFYIDFQKNQWFLINIHNLNGRTTDIDITKNIAIIRGVDSHQIIYHSIWNGFQQKHYEELYFYAPKVKQFDFFEDKYGKGSFLDWHYNQSHQFIFGVSNYDLVLFPWQEVDAGVECYTNNYVDLDHVFMYTLNAYVQQCDQQRAGLYSVLEACHLETNFTVKVEGILIGKEGGRFYSILIGLGVFLSLFTVLLIFYYQYRRYKFKKAALDREIEGFISRGTLKSTQLKTDDDIKNNL